MAKPKPAKGPKSARKALAEFRLACDRGDPPYGALVRAVEFLLKREAQKEKDERDHERLAESALDSIGDGREYGSG